MMKNINFNKYNDGLVPAIIQDVNTDKVLMLGYMNKKSLSKTIKEKHVTFYSRSKKRLWTKGETSGNHLDLIGFKTDCDKDTLLIKVKPNGPVCHSGADTCFSEENKSTFSFVHILEDIIKGKKENYSEESYTSGLFKKGINRIAQKFGEESTELIIESKDNNNELFLNEAADLLFHYMVLLRAKNFSLKEVIDILEKRHK